MSTARGILNGLLLSAVLWIAIMALACPVHAQNIATWTTCTSTLLACPDDRPDCNTVTCTKSSLDDLGKPHVERVALPPPTPEHAMHKALLYVAWASCQLFDGITSAVALQYPQLHEANPLLRGRWFVPVKLGLNLGEWLEYRYLQHTGHPKLARSAPIIMASSGCLAGVLNTRTIRSVN